MKAGVRKWLGLWLGGYLALVSCRAESVAQVEVRVRAAPVGPRLEIDGKPAVARMVFSDQLASFVRARAAGIRIFAFDSHCSLVDFDLAPDFAAVDVFLNRLIDAVPDALVVPRLSVRPSAEWLARHPKVPRSLASAEYLRNAQALVARAARHWQERYSRNFAGVQLAEAADGSICQALRDATGGRKLVLVAYDAAVTDAAYLEQWRGVVDGLIAATTGPSESVRCRGVLWWQQDRLSSAPLVAMTARDRIRQLTLRKFVRGDAGCWRDLQSEAATADDWQTVRSLRPLEEIALRFPEPYGAEVLVVASLGVERSAVEAVRRSLAGNGVAFAEGWETEVKSGLLARRIRLVVRVVPPGGERPFQVADGVGEVSLSRGTAAELQPFLQTVGVGSRLAATEIGQASVWFNSKFEVIQAEAEGFRDFRRGEVRYSSLRR